MDLVQAGLDFQTGGHHVAPRGFLPFDAGLLVAGAPRPFAIYERVGTNVILLCETHVPVSRQAQTRLQKSGQSLYVPVNQGPLLSAYAESVLGNVLSKRELGLTRRLELLESSARAVMADVLANPLAPGIIGRSRALAGHVVGLTMESPAVVQSLSSVFHRDYYTFTHCVHVCMLSLGLYRHAVSAAKDALSRLGLGALLHDVGKSLIRSEVLNKPGRLTADEFEEMASHTSLGWQVLQGHGVHDPVVRDAVLCHHEKLDGRGYPSGLTGDKISEIARVVAIADVYDALTTNRSYRSGMSHDESADLMRNTMAGTHLDAELLDMFLELAKPRAPQA